MLINHEMPFAGGQLQLRDLTVHADHGTLRYRWRRDTPGSRRGGQMFGGGGGFPWGITSLTIADSDGNRPAVSTGRNGRCDGDWQGDLELQGTLSPDAAWLEVNGIRVELDHRTAPWRAWVEPLPDEDPIARFLWRHLAVGEMPFGHTTDLEPAVEALLAAGAVHADTPPVTEIRAVAARMPNHRRHPQPPSGGSVRGLPEPWRSLLRRLGRSDGPERALVIGAVGPRCDGIQFAAHALASDQSGFDTEFEVAPNVLQAPVIDELPVAWWARDDCGNHYLGGPTGWSGSDDGASGTLRYWPALDRKATRLDLILAADTHQAVISVALDETGEIHP